MGYSIPHSDDELLSQCKVQVFRGSGPGGQSVNTTDSAVRLIHDPSGIVVVARRERSQYQNKRVALKRLRRKLEEASQPRRQRVETHPTKASVKRRLESKRKQSLKKQQRSRPIDD
ncbi:MAG: peptide chain release factor-like protein [Coriobacteriia bacterium]|nr:peptide chain release factor-like protein [Coriobacteriia bacterium]